MNLAALPHESIASLEALDVWLRDPADLARLARFDPYEYCRNTVARTATIELVIIGWLPGQATDVHGHGDSVGVVRVLEGDLEEVCFSAAEGGRLGVTTRVIRPGDTIREVRGRVHQVRNTSRKRAITLHAYSPPLQRE